jgi:hypothetical protein
MSHSSLFHRALLVTAAVLTVGCKRTASIEGELSIVQAGKVRQGLGHTVFLLRNGDSISQAVDRVCSAWKDQATQREQRARDFDVKAERFKRSSERASMRAAVALLDSVDKYRQAAAAERRTQSEDSPVERIRTMVRAAADTQVQTDLEARYRIANLTPGIYTLYAEWLSDQDNMFWAAVPVGAGEKKKQNLDQATLATSKFRCQ